MKVRIRDIPSAFHNANQAVIAKGGFGLERFSHIDAFEQAYNVKIIQSAWGSWDELEFPSSEAYTWFMLKWGC